MEERQTSKTNDAVFPHLSVVASLLERSRMFAGWTPPVLRENAPSLPDIHRQSSAHMLLIDKNIHQHASSPVFAWMRLSKIWLYLSRLAVSRSWGAIPTSREFALISVRATRRAVDRGFRLGSVANEHRVRVAGWRASTPLQKSQDGDPADCVAAGGDSSTRVTQSPR